MRRKRRQKGRGIGSLFGKVFLKSAKHGAKRGAKRLLKRGLKVGKKLAIAKAKELAPILAERGKDMAIEKLNNYLDQKGGFARLYNQQRGKGRKGQRGGFLPMFSKWFGI